MIALVAMAFSFSETVWASTCAPLEMDAVSSAAVEQVPAHDCMLDALHEREGEDTNEDERPCPFSPAAAQVCAGVASLPSHVVGGLGPSPEDGVSTVFSELTQHDLLLQEALFHPPRA